MAHYSRPCVPKVNWVTTTPVGKTELYKKKTPIYSGKQIKNFAEQGPMS
jgi:hypothetical protein